MKSDSARDNPFFYAALIVGSVLALNCVALYRHIALGTEFSIRWLSYLQMPAIAAVSLATCMIISRARRAGWRGGPEARMYLLAGIGFAFLAIDETASVHNAIADALRSLLGMRENGWAGLIDDAIVMIYGLIAIWFIGEFAKELFGSPFMRTFICLGFAAFFVMCACDFMNHSRSVILSVFIKDLSSDSMYRILRVVKIAEDASKVIGESFFLTAFVSAFLKKKVDLGDGGANVS